MLKIHSIRTIAKLNLVMKSKGLLAKPNSHRPEDSAQEIL